MKKADFDKVKSGKMADAEYKAKAMEGTNTAACSAKAGAWGKRRTRCWRPTASEQENLDLFEELTEEGIRAIKELKAESGEFKDVVAAVMEAQQEKMARWLMGSLRSGNSSTRLAAGNLVQWMNNDEEEFGVVSGNVD